MSALSARYTAVALLWGAVNATLAGDFPPPALEHAGDRSVPARPTRQVAPAAAVVTPFGASVQVNVSDQGWNIVGDAANEPSLCVDPTDANRMAVGWRQFDSVTNDFRQAGWAYTTDSGQTWRFAGVLETNVFRSDPVLAADADGWFYYLSLMIGPYRCDLWRSTTGGASWQRLGPAFGGDKQWMAIDTTTGPGRGHIYQAWSPYYSSSTNGYFSRSTDGGFTWMTPIPLPQPAYWGTLEVGPDGELYFIGWNGRGFWLLRSTNAPNRSVTPVFDLARQVDLGGEVKLGREVNPVGLTGQPWVAVDRSTGPTRGHLYLLCSAGPADTPTDIMFSRSADGGLTWSMPRRLNDDPPARRAWHWFGTMSVAPNGRLDVCWNDTRSQTNNTVSELYYVFSNDGGGTWSSNRAVSPPFNHTLGYPVQRKMGDYIQMVSLDDSANIAYAATFNGEQDIFFLRLDHPPAVRIARHGPTITLTWPAVPGRQYCVQARNTISDGWTSPLTLGCVATNGPVAAFSDVVTAEPAQRFYRVLAERRAEIVAKWQEHGRTPNP